MRSQKRVYIIDFDNTLLDIERLKNHIASQFPGISVFQKEYKKAKSTTGFFKPENLPEKYRNYFLKAPFKKYLFLKAKDQIKKLQKTSRVIIFSYGDKKYQSLKIKNSDIEKLVGRKNILIVQNKKEGTEKLIRDLRKQKYSEIFFIDDVAEVLEKAFEINPDVINVWIRYGKYKNKMPLMRNSIIREVSSLSDAVAFAAKFVAEISIPKTHLKYPILSGIDENQIADLVSYTGRDKTISKWTHDDGRFKSKKTFKSWKSRGKIIYTLINRSGKLLGIIWFAKKKFKKINYTLGIRVYPPVRGKGLSYKFMKSAAGNFFQTHKKEGLWISVQKGNIPAEHLYKKFGFKIEEEKKSGVFMSYSK